MLKLSDVKRDRTRFDAGRKRSGTSGDRLTPDNNLYRPILAIDGEGITDANGDHRYVMLACSNGSSVQSRSLSTVRCFEYLLGLPKKHLIVGFSIGYDICKWITNLSREHLSDLGPSGVGMVRWKNYTISWAPTKYIRIHHKDGRSIQIYDVFGFYQRSFVAALEEWKVGTPEQVERITKMKESRSSFSNESQEEMLAYCLEECQLLVQLVQKLRDALIEGGIPIRHWYGAGAIAAAIMEKEGVIAYTGRQVETTKETYKYTENGLVTTLKTFKSREGPPKRYSDAILSAYFGGRFELSESGHHEKVWLYDIRSAYPHILRTLPCLTHMVYREVSGFEDTEWGLYLCEWKVADDVAWPPFPFREANTRQILYPTMGKGWYHAAEVRAGMALYGPSITVHKTIIFDSRCPESCGKKPFAFIPGYFAFRNELKKRGSQAQLTVKLGLNSLYGKTAQGVGWGDKKPPFQSYVWAGMITAGTRAMILDMIRQNSDAIIWTATDGIGSKVRLNANVGNELGEWEERYADWAFCVQPGVYQYHCEGETKVATRGFGKKETGFDAIRKAYNEDPVWGVYSYDTTRFVGLGSALMRTDFWSVFGKWIQHPRKISFCPSKRTPRVEPWETATPPIRLYSPASVMRKGVLQDMSAPYEPKST